MNCFEHQESSAVGLCKVCSKGLCPACAVDLGHSLTCSGNCQKEAGQLHVQILQNRKSMRSGRRNIFLWPAILLFMGSSMLINEMYRHGPVINWGTVFGGGMVAFSFYMFVIYRRWKMDMDASTGDD